jgi:hypothetical protein
MNENKYQSQLISKIKERFPGCMVLKNDPNYIQGIPDLTVFYKKHWATLECKKSEKAKHQPNQDYYICEMNKMSFSAFIYPENEKEVLDELERSFKRRARRQSCVSRSI